MFMSIYDNFINTDMHKRGNLSVSMNDLNDN